MSLPVNPCLLGYTDTRYSLDPLDVATREELDNPAVSAAVVSDLAKVTAREYQSHGYKASTNVLRRNGRGTGRYGRITFPDIAPRDDEPVLLVDPEWYGLYIPSPRSLPDTPTLWAMAGASRDFRQADPHKLYRPLWLDVQTGQWLAFTNIPHEYTGMPRSMCRPYLGHAKGYDRPAPPDPEATGRVEHLHLKVPASRYADLHINTR